MTSIPSLAERAKNKYDMELKRLEMTCSLKLKGTDKILANMKIKDAKDTLLLLYNKVKTLTDINNIESIIPIKIQSIQRSFLKRRSFCSIIGLNRSKRSFIRSDGLSISYLSGDS